MTRRRSPPTQRWRTFLRNHTGDIAAVDLFVVRTVGFRLLCGLVILCLERRRLVWTNVTADPTAEWIARQITEALPWDEAPSFLIRDRDSSYGAIATRRLRAMGIRDRPIAPRAPYQVEFRTASAPFSPVKVLQKLLRDRNSPDGRAMILLTPLIQSIHGFAEATAQCNARIEEVKRLPDHDDAHRAHLYFGTPFAPGRADDRYPNFMKALKTQTDDCIAFSILMIELLRKCGEKLPAQYGRSAPAISAPELRRAGHLLPDMAHYSDWSRNRENHNRPRLVPAKPGQIP